MPAGVLRAALSWLDAAAHGSPGPLVDPGPGFEAYHRQPAAARTAFLTEAARGFAVPVPEKDDEGAPRDTRDGTPLCCNEEGEYGNFELCAASCEHDPRFTRRRAAPPKEPPASAAAREAATQRQSLPRPAFRTTGPAYSPAKLSAEEIARRSQYVTWWTQLEKAARSEGFAGPADVDDGAVVVQRPPHRSNGARRTVS
mmetsp:Transcript_113362/g.315585  ORF Transcript_113362/g.315585 Transcript_113362/m.315585 type:complete len:199 (+) Transcript_113362:83-679(+)